MGKRYAHECVDCGTKAGCREKEYETIYCTNCGEEKEAKTSETTRYLCVIEVDGSINHNGRDIKVSGVTERNVTADDEREAKKKAISEFKEKPDYNTDISVNKDRFPDGRYLDDWSYRLSSAKVIDVIPTDDFPATRVKWRDRGTTYCKHERK